MTRAEICGAELRKISSLCAETLCIYLETGGRKIHLVTALCQTQSLAGKLTGKLLAVRLQIKRPQSASELASLFGLFEELKKEKRRLQHYPLADKLRALS